MLSGDEKLVERCLHGDEAAWELVVKAYGKRIYNLSYRYTNRTDVSEDLTQDIFVRIYRNLRSYRAEAGSFQSWILKVARNLIIDHYRQSRRYPQTGGSDLLEEIRISDDRAPDPQRCAERVEASKFLRGGLGTLSPELREALILRELEGLSYSDIAEICQVPEGTVKSRINRGRIELAKLLMKRSARTGMKV